MYLFGSSLRNSTSHGSFIENKMKTCEYVGFLGNSTSHGSFIKNKMETCEYVVFQSDSQRVTSTLSEGWFLVPFFLTSNATIELVLLSNFWFFLDRVIPPHFLFVCLFCCCLISFLYGFSFFPQNFNVLRDSDKLTQTNCILALSPGRIALVWCLLRRYNLGS